jgi:hypothetical protein
MNMEKKEDTQEIPKWILLGIAMMKVDPPPVVVLRDVVKRYCELTVEKATNLKKFDTAFKQLSLEKWPVDLRKEALIKSLGFFKGKVFPFDKKSIEFLDEEKNFFINYIFPNFRLVKKELEKLFLNLMDSLANHEYEWIIDNLPSQFRKVKLSALNKQLASGNFFVLFDAIEGIKKLFPRKMPPAMEIARDRAMEQILEQVEFNEYFDKLFTSFKFSPQKRLELIRNAFAKPKEGRKLRKEVMSYLVLRLVPELPDSEKEEYFDYLHATENPKQITPQALKVIRAICGKKYIILTRELSDDLRNRIEDFTFDFHRMNDIPVIDDIDWFVRDTEQKIIGNEIVPTSVLLCREFMERNEFSSRPRRKEQLILLYDSNLGEGFVYKTDPRNNTVEEAIARGYSLDPEKFKGFLVEK